MPSPPSGSAGDTYGGSPSCVIALHQPGRAKPAAGSIVYVQLAFRCPLFYAQTCLPFRRFIREPASASPHRWPPIALPCTAVIANHLPAFRHLQSLTPTTDASAMNSLETTPKGAVSPRNSGVPLLQRDSSETPKGAGAPYQDGTDNAQDDSSNSAIKSSKRRLFGLGKKKDERTPRKEHQPSSTEATPPATATAKPTPTAMASASSATRSSESPQRQRQSIQVTTSPHRRMRSTSPRMHSPASSQIFERDVQETASLAGDLSPNIPSHITTENHIPPVLEASSIAITDDHLDPDSVEILTHSVHQPAALTVTGGAGGGGSTSEFAGSPPSQEDIPSQVSVLHHNEPGVDDSGSNYGVAYDSNDPRRLSFISFADVVQAEHAGGSRDSVHLIMTQSSTTAASNNRSPSPMRSPVSALGTSPPTSGATSFKGLETSPSRGMGIQLAGSPTSASSPPMFGAGGGGGGGGGELMIETMRQALDKTGSGDVASLKPLSAVSSDDAPPAEQHPFK